MAAKHRILVVEDDEHMRTSLEEALSRLGYEVACYAQMEGALNDAESFTPSLVITDLRLSGTKTEGGLEVIAHFAKVAPDIPVILITAHSSIQTAVAAIKGGAYDYIEKPFDLDTFEIRVKQALERYELRREVEVLRKDRDLVARVDFVIGESPQMKSVCELIDKVAPTGSTVFIQGESGTGKEVIAQAIHYRSPRYKKPYYAVNCAALSAGLLESELFGHEKGAFTHADRMRQGRFELADGGTILLDEVSEIAPDLQAKLLRVLQERSFERVGSSRPISVDVRVISTTNRSIEKWVADGKFREDLYFRLNVVPIVIPPLRERREDIPALARHFLRKFLARDSRGDVELSPSAIEKLNAYSWPGNVRELGNVIERAFVLSKEKTLSEKDFAFLSAGAPVVQARSGITAGMSIEEMERDLISETLKLTNWDRQKTADMLGITTKTLRAKIKQWNMEQG
ncbi:MAG: sigma-54 dependent transcriptional regulator [Planctomycetes bacterium]|nr:sigma-54 dependent transcriptional regulator [Planctomycetota bacterium]